MKASPCMWLLVCLAFFLNSNASALIIDEFGGDQEAAAVGPGAIGFSSLATATAIGGTRSLRAEMTAGGALSTLRIITGVGIGQHSQDFGVSGHSLATWDGDLDPTNLDPTGLGGIDFTQDFATAIRLNVLGFDYPLSQPVTLIFTIYDASQPDGSKYSRASLVINNQINVPTNVDIPFTDFITDGPGGGVDWTNVGAVTMYVDGTNPAIDLALAWIGTNGECVLLPDQEGRVIDECEVCGGDNSTCTDCLDIPNGDAEYDECGVCDGDNSTCTDCAGDPGGEAEYDECGICEGDGSACIPCEERDQSTDLTELDQGAKEHENLIKKMLRKLKKVDKRKRTKAWAAANAETAHALQLRNWELSWILPVIVVQCEATPFCTQVSNLNTLDEYREHSEELYNIGKQAIRRIKKKIGKHRSINRFTKKNNKIHLANVALSFTIPETQSVCF